MAREAADERSRGLPDVCVPGRRVAQKIGWVLLALFVLAGAAGAFGSGALTRASLQRDGVRVDYDRVLRARAPSELRIAIQRASPARVELAVEQPEPERIEIRELFPAPERQRAARRGPIYQLETGGDAPPVVALRILPRRPGSSELRLRLDGSPPLVIRQHVLP